MSFDRRMFGWDLPPGVRSSDIPGNRPEDLEEESFYDKLDTQFIEQYGEKGKKWLSLLDDIDPEDMIYEYINEARIIAYDMGYSQARADDAIEREYHEEEEDRINCRMQEEHLERLEDAD